MPFYSLVFVHEGCGTYFATLLHQFSGPHFSFELVTKGNGSKYRKPLWSMWQNFHSKMVFEKTHRASSREKTVKLWPMW